MIVCHIWGSLNLCSCSRWCMCGSAAVFFVRVGCRCNHICQCRLSLYMTFYCTLSGISSTKTSSAWVRTAVLPANHYSCKGVSPAQYRFYILLKRLLSHARLLFLAALLTRLNRTLFSPIYVGKDHHFLCFRKTDRVLKIFLCST